MKTVIINKDAELYSGNIREGAEKGQTVICCQRPIEGAKTWNEESIGNGMFYAYGDIEKYANHWQEYDAARIEFITNAEIEKQIINECHAEGLDISDVLSEYSYADLAEDFGLFYAV